MNTTNVYSRYPQYFPESLSIFAIVAGFGVIGNGFLIILISVGIKNRQPFELLLLNLALFDFTFCINASILQPIYMPYNGSFGCKLAGFVDYACSFATLSVPTTVAVNRYLSLYKPELCKKMFTLKQVIFTCVLTWMLSIGAIIPYAINDNLGFDDMGVCGVILSSTGIKISFSFIVYPLVFVCYTVSIICGSKIIKKLREHKSGNERGANFQSRLISETRELTNLIAFMLIIPIVTQLPAVCIKFLHMFFELDNPRISQMITAFYPLTSACNPYLTVWLIKKYKKQAMDCICTKKSNVVIPTTPVTPVKPT